MEQPDEDSLHYSQSKYKSYLQKPDLEYKDLNLLQDVSCWSETQQSKLSCPLSKSAIVQNAINDESKPTEYRIENKQDDKEEKSNQNKLKPQEEQCLVEIQQYDSNRNIKSKTYGGDQSGKNIDTDKSKLTTFSLRKQQTLNGQKPIINNSSFKNRNITNSITFMMKLKQKITYYQKVLTLPGRSKYVTETIKDYINDKSDSSHNRAQNWLLKCNLIQNIYNYLQSLNLPLIDCQSKIGIGLSFFFITYNCIFLLLLSLFTVFNGLQSRMEILNSITFFLWIIELIVKLNTSFFLKEKLIKQREDIILHYLQKKICIDLIPIIVIINSTHKIILIIVFIKTINIVSDISQFQKYLCMVVRKYYFVILINLVIKMFTFAHIIACMWFGIALIEINYMNISSWIEDGTDFENDWWKIYIQSLYWALTLMTTGSNVATTILQLMFTTFIMIFTTIAFGYLLNIVGFVLETIDKQDEQKRSDINVINEYMRQKKISQQDFSFLRLIYLFTKNIIFLLSLLHFFSFQNYHSNHNYWKIFQLSKFFYFQSGCKFLNNLQMQNDNTYTSKCLIYFHFTELF